ncbi:MAG: PQQ-binding-like beta-propeller repeat protein [Deltaproteobacteria bacterium]|nr:PQQ-binding-like beta-propeller repeat protein [Deltaproteobacteria bacterium]
MAVVLAAVTAGCAMSRPPSDGRQALPDHALRLLWRRSVADRLTMPFTPIERSTPALDPEGNRLFIGSSDEHLYALRASDGSTLWRFKARGAVASEVAYDAASKMVYFGTDDGFVYAVDADTGAQKWRASARGEVRRRPALTPEALYVASGSDLVLALDRDSGRRLWLYKRDSPEGFAVEGHAGVALRERRVFAGFSDGTVAALDSSDGSVVWERDTSADLEPADEDSSLPQYLDVDTTPVVRDGMVWAASQAAGIYALDERGGGVRWRRDDLQGVGGLALARSELYAASSRTGIVALAPATGLTRFEVRLRRGSTSLTSPVVARDLVLVGSSEGGNLYAISRSSRNVVTIVNPGDGFNATPIALGRRAFALSNGGVVYSFEIQ